MPRASAHNVVWVLRTAQLQLMIYVMMTQDVQETLITKIRTSICPDSEKIFSELMVVYECLIVAEDLSKKGLGPKLLSLITLLIIKSKVLEMLEGD